MENDPDIVGMVAASAALTLSGVPFLGPIGAARVGYIDGKYVLNPMIDEMAESSLDLVVAGTADAVMMVESEAKELSEEVMLGAVVYGQKHFQPVLDAIVKLAETRRQGAMGSQAQGRVRSRRAHAFGRRSRLAPCLCDCLPSTSGATASPQVKAKAMAALVPADDDGKVAAKAASAFKEAEKDVVRSTSSTPSGASTAAT